MSVIGLQQFKVEDFKATEIRCLRALSKRIGQLPVKKYLAALSILQQSVIEGVFKLKGASSWLLPEQRSYKSLYFFLNEHFVMIGIQAFMFCPLGAGSEVPPSEAPFKGA